MPTRCWRAELAESFAAYLRACKLDERALSTLPPGRFLMPGDLEGSPALTFAPWPAPSEGRPRSGSLHAMMERRYEAYKTHVVQAVLPRAHRAARPANRADRRHAGAECRPRGAWPTWSARWPRSSPASGPGRGSFLTDLFSRRIDRILVAATKADHLHHESHDRLQAIVRRIADRALERAVSPGATVDVLAMAAVRATREGTVHQGRETLPVIIGTPIEGRDGSAARHSTARPKPRYSPATCRATLRCSLDADRGTDAGEAEPPIRFVRFRPPRLERTADGLTLTLPHISLDRALQFLIGDHLA